MKATKGAYLMAFLKVDNAFKAIAMARTHTLKVNTDTKETTSKDSGGKFQTSEAGITSWEATSENAYCADEANPGLTYDDLLDLQLAQTPVTLVLGMASQHQGATPVDTVPAATGWTPGTGCRTGEALITSLELNMPNDDKASFTVTFTGTGPLAKYPAGA